MSCDTLQELLTEQLNYVPRYAINEEAKDQIKKAGGDPDVYMLQESRTEMEQLSSKIQDHIKSCTACKADRKFE